MSSRAVAVFALAVLTACAAAGCGTAAPGPGTLGGTQQPVSGASATQCGTARTAAGVPIVVEVRHGAADCRVAMAVERSYTRAVASGKVRGAGGGAPVTIKGW